MAAIYNKVQNENYIQRDIDKWNNPIIDLKEIKEYTGRQSETDGWIRIIEQIFEAYPQLPKGNEPNMKADGTPLDGNALADEDEPGIAWTTTRLANRPRNDTNLSNVRINRMLDGAIRINAILTNNGANFSRMAGQTGRLNGTFDGPVNDCQRSKQIIEQIATKFRGEAKIAWEALGITERPRTWLEHQFNGAAAPIGMKQWIIEKFLGRTYKQEKYAEFMKLNMEKSKYKSSMTEFNIHYNNMMRESGSNTMLRENAIDHYLNRIPPWIEKECRRLITTKNIAGYLLEQVDRKFNISQGITKKMAYAIRKYLTGTAKKFIGTKLKEVLANYVIDNTLNLIEKIAIPDQVLEDYRNRFLQYILKKTNIVIRNFAELREISNIKTQEELKEFIEELLEKEDEINEEIEELGENWGIKIEEWMNPESEEFDKERMQEFEEQIKESIQIFNYLNPFRQSFKERYNIPENLQFRRREDNTWNQDEPINISREQKQIPWLKNNTFVKGTITSWPNQPPILTRNVMGKESDTEEPPPTFTEEPKETEKQIEFNPITPQTTDDKNNQFYNREKERGKYSKKKYSRKGRKQRIQEQGIEYSKKEHTRRDPRGKQSTTTVIRRTQSQTSSTRATVPPRIRITLGNRANTFQRLYQSGQRGSTFTAIGRINNKDVRIYFTTERDFDLISSRSLARQIGGSNITLNGEDQTLVRDGLPVEISNTMNIIEKKADDEVIIEFEYFILKLEKVFISGAQTTEDYITIGNRTMKEHQMQFDFWKNQFSISNPLHQPSQEKTRLYAKNIYDNTEFANNLSLSEMGYQTQDSESESNLSNIEMMEEYLEEEKEYKKPKHDGKRFVIIILKDEDGCWISKRTNKKKPYYKLWQFPGGKVEEYETYKEGAIRELQEETGIKRDKKELEYIFTDRYEGITCQIFMIRLYKEKPQHLEKEKMTEWRKIENKELESYKMTPSIEKNKDLIIKELNKEEIFGTPPKEYLVKEKFTQKYDEIEKMKEHKSIREMTNEEFLSQFKNLPEIKEFKDLLI
nr:13358_t:CDS:2 [Entrophospora candida]